MPLDGLRSLPPSKGDGDGSVGDQRPEARLPQHGAEATRPPRHPGGRHTAWTSPIGSASTSRLRGSGIRGSGRQWPGCRGGRVRATRLMSTLPFALSGGVLGAVARPVDAAGRVHRLPDAQPLVGHPLHDVAPRGVPSSISRGDAPAAVLRGAGLQLLALHDRCVFAILGALLVVLVVVTLRARLVSQRFLVVAFFLLPTGGFLFDEVGYLDQLLYLMLFASFWLLRRRGAAWIAVPMIMSLAMFTHEIAIVTVIPILGFVVLRDIHPTRDSGARAAGAGRARAVRRHADRSRRGAQAHVDTAGRELHTTPRRVGSIPTQRSRRRWRRTRCTTCSCSSCRWSSCWALRSSCSTSRARAGRPRTFSSIYLLLGVGAIASPIVLSFAGWDEFRWAFLLMTNFFIGALALARRHRA